MQAVHKKLLWLAVCLALVLVTAPLQSGVLLYQAASRKSHDYSGQGIPLTPQELQALVAPIALDPDPLVGEILAGATYPDQITAASDFLQTNKSVSGNALMQLVSGQPWDPSVKALAEFPTVLYRMSQNLAWTSQLGESYHNQQGEVMTAIQALRAKALAAGNLKAGSQLRVDQPTPDIVIIQPGNPQVVYLPLYNPALVYGAPLQTPGYRADDLPSTSAISFAPGIAVGALVAGGCCDWGWSSWNCNWYHGVAYYHDVPYNGNNVWHGDYYGGQNYYGNHTYHTSYDYTHPYTAFGRNRPGIESGSGARAEARNRNGQADPFDLGSGGWTNTEEVRGWGASDTGGASTLFSSWDNHPGASTFGRGGWGDRVASFRGWMTHGGAGGGWGTGGRLTGAQ